MATERMPSTVPVPGLGDVHTGHLIAGGVVVAAGIALRYSGVMRKIDKMSPAYQGISLGLVLAPSVSGLFSAPNPSLMTVATFANIPGHMNHWIHKGNREAVGQCFLLGLGGSLLTGSWWPFVMVMSMAAWKVYSYEGALDGGESGPRYDMRDGVREDVSAATGGG
jgi:hypothetical protein